MPYLSLCTQSEAASYVYKWHVEVTDSSILLRHCCKEGDQLNSFPSCMATKTEELQAETGFSHAL